MNEPDRSSSHSWQILFMMRMKFYWSWPSNSADSSPLSGKSANFGYKAWCFFHCSLLFQWSHFCPFTPGPTRKSRRSRRDCCPRRRRRKSENGCRRNGSWKCRKSLYAPRQAIGPGWMVSTVLLKTLNRPSKMPNLDQYFKYKNELHR